MPESRYLRLLYGLVIGLLAVVIAFNWLVDPFSLFGAPQVRGFNANKPGYVDHLRLTHVYRVERLKPDCILIGTSRTGRGLRPDHASLVAHDCYNLALPAISIYEMRRYLQHAQAVRSLEHVVLALDLRVMNALPDRSGAFRESRLVVDGQGRRQFRLFNAWLPDMSSSLASLPALQASVNTIRKQGWVRDTLSSRGFWMSLSDSFDHATAFRAYTANTLRRYEEAGHNEVVFRNNEGELRALLREAYASGADARILISPSHAWHWQALWQSGLWSRLEEMKRLLVRLNAEEAARGGRDAFPIWDFSGSYGPALEPVPKIAGATMEWFWEPVHYKSSLGDVLLSRIEGAPAEGALADFGVRLDRMDIEAHLLRLRELQQRFAADEPDVVALIAHLAPVARGTDSVASDR